MSTATVEAVVPPSFADVRIQGKRVHGNIAAGILEGRASIGTSLIGELALTVYDPDFALLNAGLFKKLNAVDYRRWRQEISVVETGAGQDGRGQVQLRCRSAKIGALKRRRGTKIMRNSSPTDFVRDECEAVGAVCVAQDSPKRKQVARDVRKAGQGQAENSTPPSSWTTFERFASELGYIVFEAAGTVYFGKPSWLVARDSQVALVTYDTGVEQTDALTVPAITDAVEVTEGITVSFTVPAYRADEFMPGDRVKVRVPPYEEQTFMVTQLEFSVAGDSPLSVTAGTPVNPTPAGTGKTDGRGDTGDDANGGGGRPRKRAELGEVLERAGFKGHALDVVAGIAIAASGGGGPTNRYVDAGYVDRSVASEKYVAAVGMFATLALRRPGNTRRDFSKLRGDALFAAELFYDLTKGGTDFSGVRFYEGGAWRQYEGNVHAMVRNYPGLPPLHPHTGGGGTGPGGRKSGLAFAGKCLAQAGDSYSFGAEVNLDDPNPNVFDCSELVQWAAHQVGCFMPDGSANQETYCRNRGTIITVERAIATRGALLFASGHVAVSLGDGRTIEAVNREYGVRIMNARGRVSVTWHAGGLVPGMRY